MATKYTPEQIDKILQKLPEELQEALFSTEAADAVWNACEKRSISVENRGKIAEYMGYVLLGLLLPQEFEEALVKEIKLPKKTAQEIAREINRFVFYPVKPALEQLHSTAVGTRAKEEKTPGAKQKLKEPKEEPAETPQQPAGEDAYREAIE